MSLRLLLSNNLRSISKRFSSQAAIAYDVLQDNGDVANLTKLNNGLSVASYNNHRNVATVGVWVESGSSFENSDNNGVASLFEHLAYTGTHKRTAQQLQAELAKFGARLSSHTSRDHTAYYAECFSGDIDKVVEIIADVMRNSKLEPNHIEEQRNILLQKLEENDLDYRNVVLDYLHKAAFQGTVYSLSPSGSSDSIKSLTRQDIIDFLDDHYKPTRMVLTGVGGVDHQQLSDLAERYFGDLSNEYKRKIPEKSGVRFTGSEFIYRNDNYPLMYGAVAVEGVPRGHIDAIPLLVASKYVGQWDRTHGAWLNAPKQLVQQVCLGQELHYYDSFTFNYDRTGLFGYYFEAAGNEDFELITNFLRHIHRQWKYLAVGVTDNDIENAKNTTKTDVLQSLENNTALAAHISEEALSTGGITPLHLLERKIHYVNANAVREAVYRNVYDQELACTCIGRAEAFPNYHIFRTMMSYFRL